jgi:hypothetical protein
MITFIVPLRSKVNSTNWERISSLCENTLQSLTRQRGGGCNVLLVCHERPAIRVVPAGVKIIEAGFEPPSPEQFAERDLDKWRKLRLGMVAAASQNPEYVMFVDADDCLDIGLAELVRSNRPSHGMILRNAYRYTLGEKWAYRSNNNCGTNALIRCSSISLPRSLDAGEIGKCLPLMSGHTNIEERMMSAGMPLDQMSRYLVLNSQYAEQHSRLAHADLCNVVPTLRMRLGALRRACYVGQRFAQRFGMEKSQLRGSQHSRDSVDT